MSEQPNSNEENQSSLTQEQLDQCIAVLQSLNADTNTIWEMP